MTVDKMRVIINNLNYVLRFKITFCDALTIITWPSYNTTDGAKPVYISICEDRDFISSGWLREHFKNV